MSDVRFTEMMAPDIEEQNEYSDALGRVQRVSLALLALACVAVFISLVDFRWLTFTLLVALAGVTGMIVQATGRLRVLAVLMNALACLSCVLGTAALFSGNVVRTGAIMAILVMLPAFPLTALNVFFVLRIARNSQPSRHEEAPKIRDEMPHRRGDSGSVSEHSRINFVAPTQLVIAAIGVTATLFEGTWQNAMVLAFLASSVGLFASIKGGLRRTAIALNVLALMLLTFIAASMLNQSEQMSLLQLCLLPVGALLLFLSAWHAILLTALHEAEERTT